MSRTVRRWMVACGTAEAVGMTAAAGAARWAEALSRVHGVRALALGVVVAGGLVEGLSLGSAQSWALSDTHPEHRKARLVAMTVLFAGLGWAGASAPGVLGDQASAAAEPPRVLVLVGGTALGLVMGCLLGAVQAWVLAPVVTRPSLWVVANATAWPPAMAVIFLGATTPDADWPWWQVVPLGTCTGALAGGVLGLVLGAFVPWLGRRTSATRPLSASPS